MTKRKHLQIRNSTAEFLIFTNQAKEGGIILLIRFQHQYQDNTTVSPLQRNNVDQYLIYHYKIRIEKLNAWDYRHVSPELDYRKAKVVLDKIRIGTREEASNL
ncbi:MAG: hypothetical protein LBL57_03920 [Tannerella sp.]|nr:hypothetical protein [Tannerella sp.]